MDISLKKWLRLLFQIYFYNLVIGGIFYITGYQKVGISNLIDYIFPFRYCTIQFFPTSFLFFYLFIPFINLFVQNPNQKQHALLLSLGIVIHLVYRNIPSFVIDLDAITWYGLIFVIASYIRKYDIKRFNTKQLGVTTAILVAGSIITVYVCGILGERFGLGSQFGLLFTRFANSFFAITISISAFMFFKGLKIPYSSIINKFGAATFGVLLIHSNSDTMRYWLWRNVIHNVESLNYQYSELYAICMVLLIFLVCGIIDILRKEIVEDNLYDKLYNRI